MKCATYSSVLQSDDIGAVHAEELFAPTAAAPSQTHCYPFFKKDTRIMITSSFKRDVKLIVWSLSGENIITLLDDELFPGYHVFKWNGKNTMGERVSSGIYFYSLIWKNEITETKKLIYFH